MPVLCMSLLYSKAEERERRKRLADLLGLGSGTVDIPRDISRVVKIFSDTVYILYSICKATYLHTLGFDHFKHAISLGHIHFIRQRPSN